MQKKYFGTDGIRGKVGNYPMTPDFLVKLGWAAGKVLGHSYEGEGKATILIGKDTRISGYLFESALEAGIAAAGVDVKLLGPMPTPAIAYLTRTFKAQAGIVISASHNPYYDNGVKFFSANGTKLSDDIEFAIEKELENTIQVAESDQLGKASRINDAGGRYIEYCKSTIPMQVDLNNLKIVIDCANGATYQIAPNVYKELGANIHSIGITPDGLNINKECGSTEPESLAKTVIEQGANLGIALDGDGDRVLMVDHMGEVIDGDQLLYIIAKERASLGTFQGGVVGTLMSNLGMELGLKEIGVDFCRTKVGDRYVMSEMIQRNWLLGGESSGHIICREVTSTGDGIISSLQVLATIVRTGKSLHELANEMSKFPQTMINVPTNPSQDLVSEPSVKKAIKNIEEKLNGRGRVLLRPSGTEPVIRVMVEGEDHQLVESLAKDLAKQVEKATV